MFTRFMLDLFCCEAWWFDYRIPAFFWIVFCPTAVDPIVESLAPIMPPMPPLVRLDERDLSASFY